MLPGVLETPIFRPRPLFPARLLQLPLKKRAFIIPILIENLVLPAISLLGIHLNLIMAIVRSLGKRIFLDPATVSQLILRAPFPRHSGWHAYCSGEAGGDT